MLEVLRRVIQEVNGARNLDAALSTMVRRIRKAMQTDVCSFYLYDKELESLVLMETIGLRTQAVGRVAAGGRPSGAGGQAQRAAQLGRCPVALPFPLL